MRCLGLADGSERESGSSCAAFLCLCASSSSGQSDSGAVCVGDGVASEHWPGQELHLALLGERPAAGDASHRRLGFRTAVSFHAPHTSSGLFVASITRLLGPESALSGPDS